MIAYLPCEKSADVWLLSITRELQKSYSCRAGLNALAGPVRDDAESGIKNSEFSGFGILDFQD